MGRWVACALLFAACSFTSAGAPDDGQMIDARHDAPKDVSTEGVPADAQQCFDAHLDLGHFCLTVEPPGDFHITADNTVAPFDTTNDPRCDPQITDFCVVAGKNVQIDGGHTFLVKGSLPLVIVSQSTMQIDGTLDVSSHRSPANRGPDASPGTGCTGSASGGHGGGYGGSFGTQGGTGGNVGGVATVPTTPPTTTLHGGCSGSDGGSSGGQRGNGGGAVYLIALTNIVVTGTINASGAGGGGAAPQDRGGGGGGGGGMIVFDTPTLSVQGSVFANGGGGGEGSDNGPGRAGNDPTMYTTGGTAGGGLAGNGGDGGVGGAGGTTGGTGADGGSSGGGGGGGGGVIYTYVGSATGTQISPPLAVGP